MTDIYNTSILISIEGKNFELSITNSENDINFDDITYVAKKSLILEQIEKSTDLYVSSTRIKMPIDDTMKQLIVEKKFDNAAVKIMLHYYNNFAGKYMTHYITRGYVGNIEISGEKISLEVRNIKSFFSNKLETKYSKNCRANFGDKKCTIKKSDYEVKNIKISQLLDDYTVTIKTDNIAISKKLSDLPQVQLFKAMGNGMVPIGNEKYLQIANYKDNNIEFTQKINAQIKKGDIINIICSCNKTLGVCSDVFSNAKNFRGEETL